MVHRVRAKGHEGIRQQLVLIPPKRQGIRIIAGWTLGETSSAARVDRDDGFSRALTAFAVAHPGVNPTVVGAPVRWPGERIGMFLDSHRLFARIADHRLGLVPPESLA